MEYARRQILHGGDSRRKIQPLLCKIFLFSFSVAITLASCNTACAGIKTLDNKHSSDNKAIQEVQNGIRTEANAAWWGFKEEDSTAALQSAISSKAKKIVVPNMGKPWVVETIWLESDKEIVFEKGTVLAAKPGAFRERTAALFRAVNKKNITLIGYGAELIMRKQDYMEPPYEKAEWRHCISIQGCQNVKIYGLRLASSGGDGIYIGRGLGENHVPKSDNIHIKDVVCDQNYRQGISIISASNLLIENCIFQHTQGIPPQAGIDFEPNNPDEVLENCKVRYCTISDNFGFGIAIYLPALNKDSKHVSIEIEKCQILRNKHWAVFIAGKDTKNLGDPRGSILINNSKIDGEVKLRGTEMLDIKIEQ